MAKYRHVQQKIPVSECPRLPDPFTHRHVWMLLLTAPWVRGNFQNLRETQNTAPCLWRMRTFDSVYSGADQRKHQSSASLALVRVIHRWRVNSPQKGPVTRKMFPFDDVIMTGKFITVIRVLTGNLFNHAPGNVISKGAMHSYLHPLKHNASNRWLSERLQYLQCNGDATVFH